MGTDNEIFTERIERALYDQGRKRIWLADILGMTTVSLRNKMKGIHKWREAEVYLLEKELFNN